MEEFTKAFESIIKFIAPPRAYSWQTLILLSIFSCIMSALSHNPLQNFLASLGWIFLIFGVSWATTENPVKIADFSISPWITGALICIFLFGHWSGEMQRLGWIFWPPISAVLASIHDFFNDNLEFSPPTPPVKQRLVNLLLTNLLISCWFQFYFILQSWVGEYPTLLTDNFKRSAFVIKLDSGQEILPRGALILNSLESPLQKNLDNKPWSEVELWLLENKGNIDVITEEAKKQLPKSEEDLWWSPRLKILSAGSGYNLELISVWQGPRSQPEEFYIRKICNINPVYVQNSAANATELSSPVIGKLKCEPLSGWLRGTP